jgi:hypothetical protein
MSPLASSRFPAAPAVQGYLAHKKESSLVRTTIGPWVQSYRGRGGVSHERGTPVVCGGWVLVFGIMYATRLARTLALRMCVTACFESIPGGT